MEKRCDTPPDDLVNWGYGLNQTIPPFDPTDEPAIERTESEVRIEIRWLR